MNLNDFYIVDNILLKYFGNEKEVTIPDGVEVIGKAAFASSYKLEKVNYPYSLKRIEDHAFFNCINMRPEPPKNVEISETAYLNCRVEQLKEVTITDNKLYQGAT